MDRTPFLGGSFPTDEAGSVLGFPCIVDAIPIGVGDFDGEPEEELVRDGAVGLAEDDGPAERVAVSGKRISEIDPASG